MMKTFAGLAVAVTAMLGIGLSIPAQATTVVGNFTVADNGQGCWTGGALLSDGTGTGTGACSFSTPLGQEVLVFTGKTWTNNGDGTVTLCATVRPANAGSDPLGIAPNLGCIGPVPVNVGPVKVGGTLVRVNLRTS